MIIFYASSASHLINMYNIRINLHPHEKAILYVDLRSRTPMSLVEEITKSKVFDEVIIIDKVKPQNQNFNQINYFSKLKMEIKKIFYHLKYFSIISRQMSYIYDLFASINEIYNHRLFYKKLSAKKEIDFCTEIFVGSCWFNGPVIIKSIFQRVNKLVVNIVDEGIGNYSRSKSELCLVIKKSKSLYTKILCKYYHLNATFFQKLFDSVRNSYYYQPSAYLFKKQFELKKIPQITKENINVFSLLSNTIDASDIELYEKKHVYCMLQDPNEGFNKCLFLILQYINHNELLLKEHPSYQVIDHLPPEYNLSSVTADKRKDAFIFEALCTHYSFDDRLIITNNSTTAFTPKFMFGSEPRIIFLYNLILTDHEQIVILNNEVNALKALYGDPHKIYNPATFDELSEILDNVNFEIMTRKQG